MKADAKAAAQPIADLLEDEDMRLRAIITLGEIGPPASKPGTVQRARPELRSRERHVEAGQGREQQPCDPEPQRREQERRARGEGLLDDDEAHTPEQGREGEQQVRAPRAHSRLTR